jgi:hypothetical protein
MSMGDCHTPYLTLRSGAKRRVSKGGNEHLADGSSFETAAARPPQDEVCVVQAGCLA